MKTVPTLSELIEKGILAPLPSPSAFGVTYTEKSPEKTTEQKIADDYTNLRCRKCHGYIQHIRDLDTEVKQLRDKKLIRFNNEDCWLWQGDGFDYPESLVCPVVMSADTLRTLLSKIPDMPVEVDQEAPVIKPCPCCGSNEVDVEETSKGCRVVCYKCGMGHVEDNWTRDYAIRSWNTRVK